MIIITPRIIKPEEAGFANIWGFNPYKMPPPWWPLPRTGAHTKNGFLRRSVRHISPCFRWRRILYRVCRSSDILEGIDIIG